MYYKCTLFKYNDVLLSYENASINFHLLQMKLKYVKLYYSYLMKLFIHQIINII